MYWKSTQMPPPLGLYGKKSLFEFFLVKFEFFHYYLSPHRYLPHFTNIVHFLTQNIKMSRCVTGRGSEWWIQYNSSAVWIMPFMFWRRWRRNQPAQPLLLRYDVVKKLTLLCLDAIWCSEVCWNTKKGGRVWGREEGREYKREWGRIRGREGG